MGGGQGGWEVASLCNQVRVGPLLQVTARGTGGLTVVRWVESRSVCKNHLFSSFLGSPNGRGQGLIKL